MLIEPNNIWVFLIQIKIGGVKMAVTAHKEKSTLRLELDNGIVDGRQRIQSKNFSKVKTTAQDEELYDTALVIGNLQSKDLLKVKRLEEISLLSE